MKLTKIFLFTILFSLALPFFAQKDKPLRLGVVGLSHGHLWEVLSRLDRGDFQVVGVAEKTTQLWNNKMLRAKVDEKLFFQNLDEMLEKQSRKP